MRLSRAIEGFYLYFITSGNSKNTAELYKMYLLRFCEFWGDPEMSELKEKQFTEFFVHMQTDYIPRRSSGNPEPLSQSSVMKVRNSLVAFTKWGIEEGLYTEQNRPDKRLKTFKVSTEEVHPFLPEEVKALLKAAEYARVSKPGNRSQFTMKRQTAKRDVALILFMLDTGLRVSEVCRLLIRDVNLKNGEVTTARFSTGIKSKGRTVYVGDGTKRAVWSYLAERGNPGQNEPLFMSTRGGAMTRGTVQCLLYDIGDKAQVNNVHPHRFRHTFAIFYLRNGGDIYTLQRALGHSTLDMVKVYLQLAESDSADAHKRASPVDNLK